MRLDASGSQRFAGPVRPDSALAWLDQATDVRRVGSETIDGASATHYTASVTSLQLLADSQWGEDFLREQENSAWRPEAPVTIDVWVDAQNRARRISVPEILTQKARPGVKALEGRRYEFSDFGLPVDVQAPPATDVAVLDVSGDPLVRPTPVAVPAN